MKILKQFLFFMYLAALPILLLSSDQSANNTANNHMAYALIYHQIHNLINQKNQQRSLLLNTYATMRQEITEQLLKQRSDINELITQARLAETLSIQEADKLTESNFEALANLYREFPKL
jgi:hypothetical protein